MNKEALRQIIKPGIVLTLFVTAGTILLWQLDKTTAPVIVENYDNRLKEIVNRVVGVVGYNNSLIDDSVEVAYVNRYGDLADMTVYRARNNGEIIAFATRVTAPDGYSGKIELLVGITSKGELLGVEVVSHKETPGLGDAIESEKSNWLRQFDGKSLNNPSSRFWKVKKDGGKFDQLTGATITPRAIIGTIKQTLFTIEENRDLLVNLKANSKIEFQLGEVTRK